MFSAAKALIRGLVKPTRSNKSRDKELRRLRTVEALEKRELLAGDAFIGMFNHGS